MSSTLCQKQSWGESLLHEAGGQHERDTQRGVQGPAEAGQGRGSVPSAPCCVHTCKEGANWADWAPTSSQRPSPAHTHDGQCVTGRESSVRARHRGCYVTSPNRPPAPGLLIFLLVSLASGFSTAELNARFCSRRARDQPPSVGSQGPPSRPEGPAEAVYRHARRRSVDTHGCDTGSHVR